MQRNDSNVSDSVPSSLNGLYQLKPRTWVVSLVRHKNGQEGFLIIEGFELQRVTLMAELGNRVINNSAGKIEYDTMRSQIFLEPASFPALQEKAAQGCYRFYSCEINTVDKNRLIARIESDQTQALNYSKTESSISNSRSKHNGEGVKWAIATLEYIKEALKDRPFDRLNYVLNFIPTWEIGLKDIHREILNYKDHLQIEIFKNRRFQNKELINAAQEVLAAEKKTPKVQLKHDAGLTKLLEKYAVCLRLLDALDKFTDPGAKRIALSLVFHTKEPDYQAILNEERNRLDFRKSHGAKLVELIKSSPFLYDFSKCDVNEADKMGLTALQKAAHYGQDEVVLALLSAPGINVNFRGNGDRLPYSFTNKTALEIAALDGHTKVVKALLLSPDIDLNNSNQYSGEKFYPGPLILAAQQNHVEIVSALIAAGANVNAVNLNKNTALEIAVESGDIEVVKALLKSPLLVIAEKLLVANLTRKNNATIVNLLKAAKNKRLLAAQAAVAALLPILPLDVAMLIAQYFNLSDVLALRTVKRSIFSIWNAKANEIVNEKVTEQLPENTGPKP